MRYFDCFSYFSEIELLKIRCEELKELNPIHVLVESTFTHTGDKKSLHFEENKHLFKDYNIRHVIVEDMPNSGEPWDNEKFQRNCAIRALHDVEDDDVIGIFDLDEIPRKEAVAYYDKRMGVAGFTMEKYSCYLNLLEGIQNWNVGKCSTWNIVKKSTLSDIRNMGPNFIINYAGWHMSFMGGLDRMYEKLFAFAHQEANNAKLLDSLEYKYATGQSLWGDDFWLFVPINETFPKYLRENQHEFRHLIRQV
jgi:beta-1,4-mannosyl-glycoprotein beta-1,4-N-acetylglucosaminyltransferase